MDVILTRAGLWFGAVVLAIVAGAFAHDSGFAAQMMIVAVVALAGLWISVARADVGAIASGILRVPTDPSKYDDDPVRWGVLATVIWAIVGMAAGLLIACHPAHGRPILEAGDAAHRAEDLGVPSNLWQHRARHAHDL